MTSIASATPSYAEANELQAELAAACGVVNAGTAQVVGMVATALANGLWQQAGIMSPQHYVSWQCGFSPARAHQVVALARRWDELPVAAAAFTSGTLSFDQMTTIARYAPAEKEAEVTAFARTATVSQLRRTLSRYGFDAESRAPKAEETRRCTFGPTERGTWRLNAELPVDEGARVEATIRAVRDELFHDAESAEEKAAITWADALLHAADRATGSSRVRRFRDRHRVYLHVDVDDAGELTSRFHLGSPLATWLRRYLTCDATVTPILEQLGLPIGFGMKVHTVPERLRVIVEHRDGGCRIPGCSKDHFLVVHHIIHWEDQGPTESWNLICLCPHHHRLHHRGLLGITGNADDPDGVRFTDERGRTIPGCGAPAPPDLAPTAAATRLGYPWAPYAHGSGERLHEKWVDFGEPSAN